MSIFNSPCPHNDGKECEHCHSVMAQDGWTFRGCFCHPNKGKFIAEVKECPKKSKEDKATPMQQKRIGELRAMGHRVWIADSKAKVNEIIDELCRTRTGRTHSDGRENMPDGRMSE